MQKSRIRGWRVPAGLGHGEGCLFFHAVVREGEQSPEEREYMVSGKNSTPQEEKHLQVAVVGVTWHISGKARRPGRPGRG